MARAHKDTAVTPRAWIAVRVRTYASSLTRCFKQMSRITAPIIALRSYSPILGVLDLWRRVRAILLGLRFFMRGTPRWIDGSCVRGTRCHWIELVKFHRGNCSGFCRKHLASLYGWGLNGVPFTQATCCHSDIVALIASKLIWLRSVKTHSNQL